MQFSAFLRATGNCQKVMSIITQDYEYLTEICLSCDEKNDPDQIYISPYRLFFT